VTTGSAPSLAGKVAALAEAAAGIGTDDQVIAVPGRADDADHVEQALAATVAAFGGLDILVNNVGVNPVYGPVGQTDPEAARKIFAVNVVAALIWTEQARRAGLGTREGANVVNVASVAGLNAAPGIGVYGASKAALLHLTRQLALELAPAIRVNAVAPAVVKTRFAAALYEGREESVAAGYPLGRLGVPEDVAGAVAYLCSSDAAWVTGQTLVLDGGLTLAGGLT
jgi:NAD(P)-dependent dehydrogenase (short-subunit alcohol dehydrogenase family)